MIFVGDRPGIVFTSRKEATKRVFECGLSDRFTMVLYADYTGVGNGECDQVCFLVPVHYPSFVFSFDQKVSLEKSVDKFFVFANKSARDALYDYVLSIENREAEKIPFLKS